jgi:hypothetical protein
MRLPLLVLHVSAGILAMVAGALAVSFRKGSPRHRRWGRVFVVSMLTVSAAGAVLAFMKSEPDNVLGGVNSFYLVATAWATARRGRNGHLALEWGAPPIALAISAIWIAWALEVTRGRMPAGQNGSAGGYFFFGILALLCVAGDVRMLVRVLSERERLLRHLWRMCFGWGIATVSFFLGQQQVFPARLRGSIVLVLLSVFPLLLLVFWYFKVRFTSTYQNAAIVQGPEPTM